MSRMLFIWLEISLLKINGGGVGWGLGGGSVYHAAFSVINYSVIYLIKFSSLKFNELVCSMCEFRCTVVSFNLVMLREFKRGPTTILIRTNPPLHNYYPLCQIPYFEVIEGSVSVRMSCCL